MRDFFNPWVIGGLLALCLASGAVVIFLSSRSAAPEPVVEVVPVPAVQTRRIGTSVEGRAIEAHTYGTGDARILFVGGIHGGYEWNSVVLAYRIMDYLSENPANIPANVSVTVVPNLNPDAVYEVVGKDGRFTEADVLKDTDKSESRFNANDVDLNRNFDCRWQSKSTWRSAEVSAGTEAFSEPEARALRDFVAGWKPAAAIFWHSKADAVYGSECGEGILPGTLEILDVYGKASGYRVIELFDAYPVTGDAEGWLASIGVPAISVELETHESVEWEQNLAGVKALIHSLAK